MSTDGVVELRQEDAESLSVPLKLLCDFISPYRYVCSLGPKAKNLTAVLVNKIGFVPNPMHTDTLVGMQKELQ